MIMTSESKVNVGVKKLPFNLQSSHNRLFIKGGKIVNDDRQFTADIYIEEGIIKQVGSNLIIPGGVRTIEAQGKLILPGGIDTHTHMQLAFMGTVTSDDFYTGTRAALAGGTTTIIDFVNVPRNTSLLEAYERYRESADAKVCCDYGLHVIVPHYNDKVSKEMETLVKEKGVNSFKVFLAYPGSLMLEDDDVLKVLERSKQLGALMMVHAENGKVIQRLADDMYAKGITGPEGHMFSRPEEIEEEATNRAILMADTVGCPLYVVHVMSKSAALRIADARREGKLVLGEPIAAGLGTDGRQYQHQCWRHAAGHVLSPPLRPDPSTPEYLMRLLASGQLECTGSDHCVFRGDQKALGKDDFRKIPNGVNGVEDRMSVIWEKGVTTGILDPCQFVAVTSTNAAKVFNLYPRKGRIEPGSDADLLVWNPEAERVISAATHHQNVDFNIFEGMRCHGVAEFVICRGQVVVEGEELHVTQGFGRFLPSLPFAHHVYGRVKVRDQVNTLQSVKREPYTGPVAEVTKEMAAASVSQDSVAGDSLGQAPVAVTGASAPSAHRPPTRAGGRNMQESSFSFSGAQIDDDRPVKTGVRTKQPPGGTANAFW